MLLFAKCNEGWELDVKCADASRSYGSEQNSGLGEKIRETQEIMPETDRQ